MNAIATNEEQVKPIWFGQLKFTILGGLTTQVDQIFSITPERAVLLERKLLKVLDEFITEA